MTAVLAGALIPYPLAHFMMRYISDPLGLPGFVGIGLGMAIAVVISTELCRLLPWMKKVEIPSDNSLSKEEQEAVAEPMNGNKLFFNRLFADTNEIVFWGSSLGGIGMIIGGIISWLMNPLHPFYSTGNYPIILCVQICTIAAGVFVYYSWYIEKGFAFTFASLLLTSSIANTYPGVWQILVPTIIVSLVLPFLMDWLLKVIKYDGRWHVCCIIQFLSCTCTIFWSFFIMKVIMPLI